MWKTAAFIACVVLTGAWAHAQPADGMADDDLAVVKRAVEKDDGATRTGEAPAPRPHRLDQARWFRVRIEERQGAKVRVNLPLALIRGLGDDVPFDWGCARAHRKCSLRLSEVLDLLEAGKDLVEIKDTDATIRIWVD